MAEAVSWSDAGVQDLLLEADGAVVAVPECRIGERVHPVLSVVVREDKGCYQGLTRSSKAIQIITSRKLY